MPAIINTNVSSLNSQNALSKSQGALQTALQRLSSGMRINSAKDDAAGLAISDRMTSQVRGLDQAARNANDGISLSQTAESGLGTATDLLQRIRELAIQSANSTNSSSDRAALQLEVQQLQQELNRVASTTQFNGLNLLDGTLNGVQFQVGANANQIISVSIPTVHGGSIGNYTATVNTNATAINGAIAGTAVQNNRFAAQVITISGNATTVVLPAFGGGESAKVIASAINGNTSTTGVKAIPTNSATLSGLNATGTVSFSMLAANSTAVSVSATINNTSDLSKLAEAINAQTASTGVVATVSGVSGTLSLTNTDGSDIKLSNLLVNGASNGGTLNFAGGLNSAGSIALGGSITNATVGGVLSFSSSSGYSIATTAPGTLLSAATTTPTLQAVSSLTIANVAGANAAIDTVDAALTTINYVRATLGAIQNRFGETVTSLKDTSEQLSAARSRIRDADFAAETAALTRAQIMQQAGTAMLAQANQIPQNVLSLLKG